MKRAGMVSLAALCSCAIDARTVEVSPVCVSPPLDGLVSDFSTARLGRCSGAPCPDALAGEATLSLGTAGVHGIVFPYDRPDSVVLALGLIGDVHIVSDETSALRIVMSYDSLVRDVPVRAGAFALELAPCLDVSGFTGISFRTAGSLGTCPLRFGVLLRSPGAVTPPGACPLDQCRPGPGGDVGPGITTVPFPDRVGAEVPLALAGMQWQFGLPSNGSRVCAADFTIDDLHLARQP